MGPPVNLASCIPTHTLGPIRYARELYDYIRAEYRQIAIMVGSTTIGRVGMLSV